jgi:hypothetical protein
VADINRNARPTSSEYAPGNARACGTTMNNVEAIDTAAPVRGFEFAADF